MLKDKTPKRFAGILVSHIILTVLILVLGVWNGWLTTQILNPEKPTIAKVQLQSLISDYVSVQARTQSDPVVLQKQTEQFLGYLDNVMMERAKTGEVIFVSEAVVSAGVPDVTATVRYEVGKLISANESAAATIKGGGR